MSQPKGQRRDREDGASARDPEQDDKPTPVVQSRERFFVRSFDIKSGTYCIAFFDEAGRDREVIARVPKDHPSARDIHNRLQEVLNRKDGHLPERLDARMVLSADGRTCTLMSVLPKTPRDKVMSENGEYDWPDALETAVELDADAALQERAIAFHQEFISPASPEAKQEAERLVREKAHSIFRAQAGQMGLDPESIDKFLREAKGADTYQQIVESNELLGQFRYDQRYDFGSQNGHLQGKSRDALLSGLFNYCSQKALHDACVDALTSVISQRERDLMTVGALKGANPTMAAEDRDAVSRETARLVSSQALLGMQEIVNARPANPEIDEIEHQSKDPEKSMHFHIRKIVDFEDKDNAGRLKAFAAQGGVVLKEYLETSQKQVEHEQKRALPKPKQIEEYKPDMSHIRGLHQNLTKTLENTMEMFD